jgi:hypothetical protein
MPKLSVWATRGALTYLLLGFTFGALLLINKAMSFDHRIWLLLPLHIEFLLMGWIVQLVFSVTYWILPRFKSTPKRGRVSFAWAALCLLNAGIWSVSVASLASETSWLVFGRVLEAAAILIFAVYLWSRVKPTETGRQA